MELLASVIAAILLLAVSDQSKPTETRSCYNREGQLSFEPDGQFTFSDGAVALSRTASSHDSISGVLYIHYHGPIFLKTVFYGKLSDGLYMAEGLQITALPNAGEKRVEVKIEEHEQGLLIDGKPFNEADCSTFEAWEKSGFF